MNKQTIKPIIIENVIYCLLGKTLEQSVMNVTKAENPRTNEPAGGLIMLIFNYINC
jgi:hypothetical protein